MRGPRGGATNVAGDRGKMKHVWLGMSRPGGATAPLSRRTLALAAVVSLALAGALALRLATGTQSARAAVRSVASMLEERTPETRLAPSGGSLGGHFGASMAVSSDGDVALVGAPLEQHGVGEAWVFTRSASGWESPGVELSMPAAARVAGACGQESAEEREEGEGSSAEEPNPCHFGDSVSISGDGEVAVVGAPHADNNEGVVWVFTRSGSTWTQSAELAGPGEGTRFGRSVAISSDGTTLLVGAPMFKGRAWIYELGEHGWQLAAGPLFGGGREGEGGFGHSVALSANGATALVGAPGRAGDAGAAWVFQRSASGWGEAGSQLTGASESAEELGKSVALSAEGNTALVGATAVHGVGQAWVFDRTGEAWKALAPLAGAGEEGEEFGYGVALSANGQTALVGSPGAGSGRGEAWLFEASAGGWGAPQQELGGGALQDGDAHFGSSVALASTAETLVVGGRSESRIGAAWVFGPTPTVEALSPEKGPSSGGTLVTITGEHLLRAENVLFGSNPAPSFEVKSEKEIVAESPRGMGEVTVTVITPLGPSVSPPELVFRYTKKSSEGGSGGGGQGGGGGGGSGGGGGNGNGATEEPVAESGSSTPQASSQVAAFGPVSSATCAVALDGHKLSVRSGRARIVLLRTGTARCAGSVRLYVRVPRAHAHRRYRTVSIGSASFAIAAGRVAVVAVKLNATGRGLLRSHHGSIAASLTLVRKAPAPARASSASVRISERRARPKHA